MTGDAVRPDDDCARCGALLFADGRCPQGHGYFTTKYLAAVDLRIHGWQRDLEAEPLGSWDCEREL